MVKYFESWQKGDWASLRSCLADEIRFDWGSTTYRDPDAFVAASSAGIEWADVEILGMLLSADRAALVYEGTNRSDGVRIRAAELLTIDGGAISSSVVVFADLGPA